MDDTALRTLADRLQYLRNLDKRREEVKSAIEGQGKLTEELSAAIDAAATLAEVEDLYRPYKQKRRTRATVAREKGLEPLAELLFAQAADGPAPEEAAGAFIDPEKGVATAEDALQGASDIIAERISDDADIRKRLRELVWKKGSLVSAAAAKEPEDTVYRLYYAFRSPLNRVQGHQVLAINRGEREGVLKVSVEMEREAALIPVRRAVLNPGAPAMAFVRAAAVAALPGRVHVPGHEPPVQFSQDTALALDVIAHPVDGLDVAAVAVEDDEAAGAVLEQAVAHPAEHLIEQLGAQVDGAGIVAQALSGAVGDGGADEHVALLLDLVQQEVGDEVTSGLPYITPTFSRSWLMKMTMVLVLPTAPVSFRRAWLINRA